MRPFIFTFPVDKEKTSQPRVRVNISNKVHKKGVMVRTITYRSGTSTSYLNFQLMSPLATLGLGTRIKASVQLDISFSSKIQHAAGHHNKDTADKMTQRSSIFASYCTWLVDQ